MITKQFAQEINASLTYDGSIRDSGMLESALNNPFQTMFGQDLYPCIFSKAAALLRSLSANHPFVDGNKRTAFLVMCAYLRKQGYKFQCDTDKATNFVISVATNKMTIEQIVEFIKKHSKG